MLSYLKFCLSNFYSRIVVLKEVPSASLNALAQWLVFVAGRRCFFLLHFFTIQTIITPVWAALSYFIDRDSA